jgi:TPR repeat protein
VLLARQYASDVGVARDEERAAVLFRKACQAGDPMGCEAIEHRLH